MPLTEEQMEAIEQEAEINAVLEMEAEMQETAMPCVGFRGDDERDLGTEENT